MAGAYRQRLVLWLVAAVATFTLAPATAGAATASWAFQPATFDFGVLLPGEAAPAPAHLELVNTGETSLDIELVTITSQGEFSLGENRCSRWLGPGRSCGVEVTFTPRSSGPKEATLEVFDRDESVPPAIAKLTGAGVSPTVTVDPTTIDFGVVQAGPGPFPERTATITNQGPGDLLISGLDFHVEGVPASPGALRFNGGTCKERSPVPPGGSCTVSFALQPLVPFAATGEMRVTDNAVDSPQVIHVSGAATVFAPIVYPEPAIRPIPGVTLADHPPKRTRVRGATFTFSGNGYTLGFECRLDDGPFRRCAPPKRYRSLRPGKHRFWVRPIGTLPAPALSYRWRIVGAGVKEKAGDRRPR